MKTLIVGVGVIGAIYGWALSDAGIDVTHFVRKGKKALFDKGIQLDVLDERKGHIKNNVTTYAVRCVEEVSPSDGYELVIVPTNSYQTEEALHTLVPLAGDRAIFLIMAANWEGTDFIDRLLPRDRYLMGYPDGGGTRRDDLYWTNLGAEVHIGEVDGKPTEKLQRVKALFERADMQPDVPENILHWLWLHNASSVGLWAGFAKHRDIKAFLRDGALLKEGFLATQELVELCRRRGADVSKYPDVSYLTWPVWLLLIMFRLLYTFNKSMKRYTAHAADSLPEAKANYDAMMKTADALAFEMPHMKKLGVYLEGV